MEIFKSSEINIRLLRHLEVSCIKKSPVNNTVRYLSRISTALKGLIPCYPLALNACKQSVSVALLQPPLEKADVVKPAVKNSKRSESVPKKAAALYGYSDEEPDQEDNL